VLSIGFKVSASTARQWIVQGGVFMRLEGADGPTERVMDYKTLVPARTGIEIRAGKLRYLRIVAE